MPVRTRHKLSAAAQCLLRERILAGDTNAQLRQRLIQAGFKGDLSRQALSYYRMSPEARETGRLLSLETCQAQFGFRARRVGLLAELAEEVQQRLDTETEESEPPLSVRDACRLYQLQFLLVSETGRLVDANQNGMEDEWMRQTKQEARPPVQMTYIQKMTLFNDIMEALIKEDRGELQPVPASLPPQNALMPDDDDDDDEDWRD